MKAGENLFDKYHQWKKDRITLAFELSRFEGVSTDEVIESMCLSRPQDERVQTSGVSDRTGKTAVYYRKVAESMNDDWYDYTLRKQQYE